MRLLSTAISLTGSVLLKVCAPDGIQIENGETIPKGTKCVVPMHAIHRDSTAYQNPDKFDAFRFSRPYEASRTENGHVSTAVTSDAHNDLTADQKASGIAGENSTVMLNDHFLTFGHSRHACPGRFFATLEMKLMLAHVVMNYDVEHIKVRPADAVVVEIKLPSENATVRIRTRT